MFEILLEDLSAGGLVAKAIQISTTCRLIVYFFKQKVGKSATVFGGL
jgi:hypothetical protein